MPGTSDPSNDGLFRAIDASRGWEEVAAQIREAILSGRLRAGDRLQSQRLLALEFGVSRALVSEALRVLEHSGLIETRTGARGGSFVTTPAADDLVRHVNLMIRLGSISIGELTDFRVLLEGQNASWAASRAGAGDIHRIRGIVESVRRVADQGPDSGTLDELDADFHIAVAEAAGNELSVAAIRGIAPSLRQLAGLVPMVEASVAAAQFGAIAEAIARRRAGSAARLMEQHIRHFAGVLAVPGS